MLLAFTTTVLLSQLLTAMKESGIGSKSDHFQAFPKNYWFFLMQMISRSKLIFAGKTRINKNLDRKLKIGKYLMQILIFVEIDSRKILYYKSVESFRKTLVLMQPVLS